MSEISIIKLKSLDADDLVMMPIPCTLLVGVTDNVGIFDRVVLEHIEAFLPLKDVRWTCAEPNASHQQLTLRKTPAVSTPKSGHDTSAKVNVLASRSFVFSHLTMSFSGPRGRAIGARHDEGVVNGREWHDVPTLEMYVVTCESVNEYRRRFKEDLEQWIVRTRASRPHAQTAVLFVPTASKSSAIRAVEAMLNKISELQPLPRMPPQSSELSPLNRVLRFDMPSRGSLRSEKHKTRCKDLLSSFADLALYAMSTRCFDIDRDIQKQSLLSPSQRSIYSDFIVRERMAQLCYRLQFYAHAIDIYKELSEKLRVLLPQTSHHSSSTFHTEEHGVGVLSAHGKKHQLKQKIISAIRAKIAGESITSRDFLSYVFLRQLSIAEESGQKNMIPVMTWRFVSSLGPAPKVLASGQVLNAKLKDTDRTGADEVMNNSDAPVNDRMKDLAWFTWPLTLF